jgi:hypothetical protein
MSVTPRFALPMLAAGQAQKELLYNEALQTLEMLVVTVIEEPPRTTPPPSPVWGSCYIVGPVPSGPWAGKAQCLAAFTSGGWRFVAPVHGMSAYVRSTETRAIYRDGNWQLADDSIASPSEGTTVDAQARSAIDQILSALRQYGLIGS